MFEGARRNSDALLTLHWLRDAAPPRLGLAVSRKVDARAVGRNRIKRVLRDEFRHLRAQLPPGAYVLVARGAASRADNEALRDAARALLRRAGALPASGAGGTMPAARPPGASPTPP